MVDWRLIKDGQLNGKCNMAVDHALLIACDELSTQPTLRLYGWNQPTITVGHSQNIEHDIDLGRAQKMGVEIVRRPTGGRALWHGSEVTYSVVAPLGTPGLGHHLKDIFESISRYLISGLVRLGVPETILEFQTGGNRSRGPERSSACFAELHFGEITAGGKKLIGSAQRRTQHAFLQHGSILIGEDFDRFTRVCRYENKEKRRQACQRLRKTSTNLQQVLQAPVNFEAVVPSLLEGFRDEANIQLQPEKLTSKECALRDAILRGS